ncbi:nuclease-related domain-containing protein [Gallaecimonas sp. GXIMD1310]|uniref:nuclease-related domain-containing protein n=1 Tax=Gallaecimonas sp. GXIMD1310 TaxID=3131926 RepID=UPI00324F519D
MASLPAAVIQLFATVLALLPIFLLVVAVTLYRKWLRRNRFSPLSSDLLRPAGYSLQRQVDEQQSDLVGDVLTLPLLLMSAPLGLLLSEKLQAKSLPSSIWLAILFICFIVVGIYLLKVLRTARRLSHLRLGFACEMAVGQELDYLLRPDSSPYRVFHDIPFDNFNVDHLVIAPNGVFVLETKGRSKRMSKGKKQARVRLENNALHFPHYTESRSLEQVRMNVKAVADWLSAATGFKVPVAGILVLPGWYIERKQRSINPYVLNARELPTHLPGLACGTLDLPAVQAIAYQVMQRVRDVNRDRAA